MRAALPKAPAGDYTIEVRLTADSNPAAAARGAFVKSLPLHIDMLADSVQQLRARLAKAPKKDGLATAEYGTALSVFFTCAFASISSTTWYDVYV